MVTWDACCDPVELPRRRPPRTPSLLGHPACSAVPGPRTRTSSRRNHGLSNRSLPIDPKCRDRRLNDQTWIGATGSKHIPGRRPIQTSRTITSRTRTDIDIDPGSRPTTPGHRSRPRHRGPTDRQTCQDLARGRDRAAAVRPTSDLASAIRAGPEARCSGGRGESARVMEKKLRGADYSPGRREPRSRHDRSIGMAGRSPAAGAWAPMGWATTPRYSPPRRACAVYNPAATFEIAVKRGRVPADGRGPDAHGACIEPVGPRSLSHDAGSPWQGPGTP